MKRCIGNPVKIWSRFNVNSCLKRGWWISCPIKLTAILGRTSCVLKYFFLAWWERSTFLLDFKLKEGENLRDEVWFLNFTCWLLQKEGEEVFWVFEWALLSTWSGQQEWELSWVLFLWWFEQLGWQTITSSSLLSGQVFSSFLFFFWLRFCRSESIWLSFRHL